jgi:hypothetical protein
MLAEVLIIDELVMKRRRNQLDLTNNWIQSLENHMLHTLLADFQRINQLRCHEQANDKANTDIKHLTMMM